MAAPTDADSTDLLLEGDPTSSDERSGASLHLSVEEISDARAALEQRLRVVHDELLGASDEDADVFALLDALLAHLIETRDPRVAWIVLVSVSTVLPRIGDVEALVRRVATYDVLETRFWLLGHVLPSARERGLLHLRMRLAVRTTVVDVSFSATDEHNTGIQRVVRRTLPHWLDSHEVVPVAWTSFSGSLRSLSDREMHRLLEWNSARVGDEHSPATELVVPWDSTVVLAEVPSRASMCDPLAALARYSGNRLTLIGYDAIPIVSAETVPIDMSDHFAKYLSVVKWAGSVAAISAAAAAEFRGFGRMLGAQGLAGPLVVECSLPADPARVVSSVRGGRPLVAVVGSKEPRKNHVAVLYAAERLWREGLDFELVFLGAYGWDTRVFRSWLRRLQRAGRPVRAPAKASDEDLWEAYAGARFTVFPSLHEGYGLPVAESLAYGTPVITTGYGSTGEIAEAGGCVTVDPRDDEQLVSAMRVLLTDDAEVERLRAQARARPSKSWEEYADEVWSVLGAGE